MFGAQGSDAHKTMIESLRSKIEINQSGSNHYDRIKVRRVNNFDESISLIKEYRCACGSSMTETNHIMSTKTNFVLDEHTLSCNSCDSTDRVRFSYLRKTLQNMNQENLRGIIGSNAKLMNY